MSDDDHGIFAQNASHPSAEAKLAMAQFAEILRNLLRALAANDATNSLASASRMMRSFQKALEHVPPDVSWYKIMEGAVAILKQRPPYDDDEYEYARLARYCMKYFAEITTGDGFSAARLSKAHQNVDEGIRHVQERRMRNHRRFD